MKVLRSGTLNVSAGAPTMSAYFTFLGLNQQGVDAEIIMYPLSPMGWRRGEEILVQYSLAPIGKKFDFSTRLKKGMFVLSMYDICHAQGVWQYPTYVIVDVARKLGKPYVITSRGMLYPQDKAKAIMFFKKLSLKIRLLNDLNRAACVQVACTDELRHHRDLGVISPIAIIPNPMGNKDYPFKKEDGKFRLGYLDCISLRKNVQGLIYAFATLDKEAEGIELLIIGGDAQYGASLKGEVEHLGLKNVKFTGFLSGEEKDKTIASYSVMAMLGEFENLGNVVLEGLVWGILCIATTGVPWSELNLHCCGWQVAYAQEAIMGIVKAVLNTSADELHKMRLEGRRVMEDNYSVDSIVIKMKQSYEWVLCSGEKLEFVYLFNHNKIGVTCIDMFILPDFTERRVA